MTKKSKHSLRRKAKTHAGLLSRLHKWPAWVFWCGGVSAAAVYALIFYFLFVNPAKSRWQALYGDAKYPGGYSIHGIDVSHYQDSIDWKKLRGATIGGNPVRFVIIKSTEGSSVLDEYFADNFRNAKEFGFIRGAYHYFAPSVPAREQAEYFLSQVSLEGGDLPPVLDFEALGSLSPQQAAEGALEWLRIVEARYKVKPVIYTYYKFKLAYLSDPVFDDYPYWIARYYVDTLRYQGKWKMWQYTDAGKLDGIKGNVDFDVYNGSMYDLMKLTIPRDEDIWEDEEE